MKNYIDKHFKHYSDNLWLTRIFIIIFIDLIYNLLIFVHTLEKSRTYLTILLIIIPLQSSYIQFIFYIKPFFRNLIFVGLVSIYCFISKIIMSLLLFNHSSFLILIYIAISLEFVFHFNWLLIGLFGEIRYQRLLELANKNDEMDRLIV
jgi:hypothetical protein